MTIISKKITEHASAAETTTANGDAINVGNVHEAVAYLSVTAVTGTNPTMDITVETSHDGVTWMSEGSAFTQATAATTQALKLTNLGEYIRFVRTLGGTDTPTFTYTLELTGKSS